MTKCYACGCEINENEPIYPMPVYDIDTDKRQYKAMGYVMCWECFSSLAMGLNMAIFTIRNRKLFCNMGGRKKEDNQ